MVINNVNLIGLLKRIDVREGKSQAGKPFASATLTLCIDTDEILVEIFSMKLKNNGEEMSSYTAIFTLLNEAKALHKSLKNEKGEVKEIKTNIVSNIEECEIIKCNSYKDFKYCRLETNMFKSNDGNVVKNYKVTANYVNRGKEDEDYKPKNIIEVTGVLTSNALLREDKEGNEYMVFTLQVPIFNKGYTKADGTEVPDRVDIQEINFECHQEEAFDYLEDEFLQGNVVTVNGEIKRCRKVIEKKEEDEGETRGFGRKIEHKPETELINYLEVLGGYTLEEEEYEEIKAFDKELFAEGLEAFEKKVEDLSKDKEESTPKQGFGRKGKKETDSKRLPF